MSKNFDELNETFNTSGEIVQPEVVEKKVENIKKSVDDITNTPLPSSPWLFVAPSSKESPTFEPALKNSPEGALNIVMPLPAALVAPTLNLISS